MVKTQNNDKLNIVVVKGIITATSNKLKKGFEATERKSVYFTTDDESAKKLTDFGLTEYTSEQNGDKYFIIKASEELNVFVKGEEKPTKIDTSLNSNNFNTDDKEVMLAILKGKDEFNREYKRLYALKVKSLSDLVEVVAENPFGDEDF